MRRPLTLTTRLLAIGSGFLAVALLSIAFTLWITWKLEGGAAAVNEAGRLRMTMMRMALAGRAEGPEALAPLSVRFDARLDLLRQGDPARPLFVPWNEDTRARFARIVEDWGRLRDGRAAPDVARADAFAARVDGFVEAIERQMARWTAALHLFQMAMMAVAIAAAVAFMAVSHWLVLAPVARLQQALARIRQGDLRTRLPVESQDEFGQLATGFNLMAHALQSSHEDLERKVAEKTSRLEERNARLAALYEVSAQVSEAGSLDTLARGFVRRVREIARADAAAMRWSDEANERYMLLAGDGLPETLVRGEHCLPTGHCHCGQPEGASRLRIIPMLPGAPAGMPHCGEAGYQALVLVPVRTQQRVLGEVDLFFRSATEIEPGMQEMLEAMASHLATAMEGLRATALGREAAVAQERSFIARELHDSIAQSLAFLKIQTQLLRDAVGRGDDAARDRSMGELDVGVRGCYADVRELLLHFRTRTSEEDIEGRCAPRCPSSVTRPVSRTGCRWPATACRSRPTCRCRCCTWCRRRCPTCASIRAPAAWRCVCTASRIGASRWKTMAAGSILPPCRPIPCTWAWASCTSGPSASARGSSSSPRPVAARACASTCRRPGSRTSRPPRRRVFPFPISRRWRPEHHLPWFPTPCRTAAHPWRRTPRSCGCSWWTTIRCSGVA
ncbi:two-component system nitrate/nitrite sensor histidine kinase NarX [Paracidovorax citrulli]|nr:two-component system nitrate/nitrite sensor histidine kinase NarX [Paracidovorax citrulli]REG70373.1 two-component system nitrate/nitrite sensor histidine kinase NarX [Paracidovorax citrulli]RLJ94925.1 two-component system nitrate/nitrite sensor histidine kinase NarX [Paracidovorax citrulli]